MGGVAKGLLCTPEGVTLVDRWRDVLAELGVDLVLVGNHPAYEGLGIDVVSDDPPGIGPLGGLCGLLRRAGDGPALALACDMPFVSRRLVERLLAAAPLAAVVAPRRDGRWEPLCACYDAPRVLPLAAARAAGAARGGHSLQRLLDEARAAEFPLAPGEAAELADWDLPEDVNAGQGRWQP